MAYIGGRFINSAGFVSGAIDWVTASLWDHFEFWFDAETMAAALVILAKHEMATDYPAEGGYLGAHAGSGIQFRPLDYCAVTREKRYKYPVKDAQFEKFVVSAFGKVGVLYNYAGIFHLLLHDRKLTPDSRDFCSEFGFAELENIAETVDDYFLNSQLGYASFITPEILHLSPKWVGKCVYSFPA